MQHREETSVVEVVDIVEVRAARLPRKLVVFLGVAGVIYLIMIGACIHFAWQAEGEAARAYLEALDVSSRVDELSGTPATLTYSSTIQEQYDHALERLDRLESSVKQIEGEHVGAVAHLIDLDGRLEGVKHAYATLAEWNGRLQTQANEVASRASELERDAREVRSDISALCNRDRELREWAAKTERWENIVADVLNRRGQVIDNPYCHGQRTTDNGP